METSILKLLKGDENDTQETSKRKMRKDMKYKNNVMTTKKDYPLNKVKAKLANDQKPLTIRNKQLLIEDFSKNVEQVVSLLQLGGTQR